MDVTYYEAILQLRDVREEVRGFVENQIKSAGKKVFLSRKKRVRNGFDYYLSSNSFAIGLGRKLEAVFGGYLKVSEKLFSRDRQTSRDLYMVNVLFRQLPFSRGDVIHVNGCFVLVKSLGKRVSGVDINTGKSRIVDFKKHKVSVVKQDIAVVSKVYPHVEVISPATFDSIPLLRAPQDLKIGEKVRVVVEDGKAFFVKC